MLRAQTLIATAASLLAIAFVFPACSTSTDTPACSNGTKDDGEDGVDCGGTCSAKCTGAVCAADTDCVSGHCNGTECGAPASKTCGVGTTVATCNNGQACELDRDCASGFCDGSTCADPPAGSHSDGVKNGGETGIDCGGSVKAQPCPDGQGCVDSTDCVGTCNSGICGPIGPTDGKKNNGETDIDCGGPSAPPCANGKACVANSDCADAYCPDATKLCTAPRYDDGVQNGTETDVDCGGTGMGMLTCAQGKNCKADTDCNGACNYKNQCVDMPSCKKQHGGDTCGYGDLGNGQTETHMTATDPSAAGHEDCCRTLPVAGYTDPNQVGKTVYLDKYEITAGRMRAFLEAIGGGADAVTGGTNPKPANIKSWAGAHRPTRWNPSWENALPQGNVPSLTTTYVVKWPTADRMYPGQDYYSGVSGDYPITPYQTTWWIRATGPGDTNKQVSGQQGTYVIPSGIFRMLNSGSMFPEFYGDPNQQPSVGHGEQYAESHALNCSNSHGAYGWSTFWFDSATMAATTAGDGPTSVSVGKAYPETLLDEKSMNCAPNALFAAFCAWDGGQLATAEVMDAITGNTVEPAFTRSAVQGGKYAAGNSYCGAKNTDGTPSATPGNTLNTFGDGGSQACYNTYYYPYINENLPVAQRDFDDSGKVASPGRVLTDVVTVNAGDEPWMDMIGNLEEVVLRRGETERFDYRGYGMENSSIQNHKLQQTTARFRGGAFGARCMRFK